MKYKLIFITLALSNVIWIYFVYVNYSDALLSKFTFSFLRPPKNPSIILENNIGHIPGFKISNPSICENNGYNLKLLILITSSPSYFDARNIIRLTWGRFAQQYNITIAFIVGLEDKYNLDIYNEAFKYKDIIQTKFNDSYTNLSYKAISMLEWVNTYCSQVKYLLKTDDDCFINVPKVLDYLTNQNSTYRNIYGNLRRANPPSRNVESKYFVSKDDFNETVFPDFTNGASYVIPGHIINELYIEALKYKPYIKLEDVFLTGIIASRLNISRIHDDNFTPKSVTPNGPCNLRNKFTAHLERNIKKQYDCWVNYKNT